MKIQFWGATEEVTGSMTFVEHDGRMGVVDSGLFQGGHDANEKNFASLPISPKSLTAAVITHAHLDHSGYLPRLVNKGFHGDIFCTPQTADLLKIILMDSASLNRSKERSLYDEIDVSQTLKLIKKVRWDDNFKFLGLNSKLIPAGHILGASSLVMEAEKKVVFSGDLGRRDDFLLSAVAPCPSCDVIIMESTYGGRIRSGDARQDMMKFIRNIKSQNRVGIIASFALARGQTLITLISEIFRNHPELKVPLYFDSPMMKEVNSIYKKHKQLTTQPAEMSDAFEEADSLDFLREWETVKRKNGPFIIISSSGMVTGGRIFRSLANWQFDKNAMLFLVGYQGESTPGRALLNGQRNIKDNEGNQIEWHGEILSSEAFSSHADQSELVDWARSANAERIFLIHGEERSKEDLKKVLSLDSRAEIILPKKNESFRIC